MIKQTTTTIDVPCCDDCERSVYSLGVLLVTDAGDELCLNCLATRERRARIERITNPTDDRPEWLQRMHDEAHAKIAAERAR